MAKQEQVFFLYKGLDKSGKKVDGEIEGYNVDLVKAHLRKQGINPITVKKKPKDLFGGAGKKITTGDIAIFARQLATMISSGVNLVTAFSIIGTGHANPNMQKMIMQIKADVEGGTSLAQSLAKHPDHFDDLFCSLVEAGEQSGALEKLLHEIATYKEKTEAIKKKVKKALMYPIAVTVVALIVTTILLIFVVPQFQEMFENFGGELPAFTKMVVNISEWMQENYLIFFGTIIVSVVGFIQARKRIPAVGIYLDKLTLKAPIVGQITEKSIIARFARTMSVMFAAGVPMVETMDSVAGAAGNYVYTEAIKVMRDEISTGDMLNQSMRRSNLFPNMVIQMVSIGEESGSVDDMLTKVADFYEEEVDNAVDGLSTLMEPFIMVFLGVVVGGLVIAMYLPIFKMGQAI